MMSAENDPLGPLPPGWGEFKAAVLRQDQRVLSAAASLSVFTADACRI